MMEEKIDKDYIKNFNHGYLIARAKPELAKMLLDKTLSQFHGYSNAVLDGIKQHNLEKVHDKQKEYLDRMKEQLDAKRREVDKGYDLDR